MISGPPGRSIPIVSKLDFTNPAYNGTYNCGVGPVAWNVVAASPFAREVSVGDWTELPALLDRLRQEPDDYIDRLQVRIRLTGRLPLLLCPAG